MATWLSHIRLAGHLFERIPNLDVGQFAIGNIAPDAGVPDEKWEKFDPPPEVTHFREGKSGGLRNIQDLSFLRQFEQSLRPSNSDRQQRSFLLGYFFHLLADKLFDRYLIKLNHPELPFDSETVSKEVMREVRREWYGLDFIYLRDHPEAFFRTVFLQAEYAGDYLLFLPAHAIRARVEYLKELYQRVDKDVQKMYSHKYQFMTSQQMNEFIALASEQLHRIYCYIWIDAVELDGLDSSIALLEHSAKSAK